MTPSKEQLQRTFDKVAKHLLTQGRRARAKSGACRYRYGKLKCAVGCLIPDELYEPPMEGTLRSLLRRFPQLREIPEIGHCDNLLRRLQVLHDSSPLRQWRSELAVVADKYDLSTAVLAEGQVSTAKEQPRKKRKPHWYFITYEECAVCGRSKTYRERRYSPRPDDPNMRGTFRQDACSDHFI